MQTRPIYDRNGHSLYHGDAREVLAGLASDFAGKVDLVVTDPPYGLSMPGVVDCGPSGTRNFDFFDGDTHEESTALALEVAGLLMPLLSPVASCYWWCGHSQFGTLDAWYRQQGWKTRFLVWAKTCPTPPMPGSGWPSACELCLYAFRPGRIWTHNGTNAPRSNLLMKDTLRHGRSGKTSHPTQKPVDVLTPLILASSRPGDLVLDAFAGSGSVLVAAKELGRRSIGIEIDESYVKIARNRLAQDVFALAIE